MFVYGGANKESRLIDLEAVPPCRPRVADSCSRRIREKYRNAAAKADRTFRATRKEGQKDVMM